MIDSIIFDLDGTLWDATYGMTESWNGVLEKNGYDFRLTRELVMSAMGLPVEGIADTIFYNIPEKEIRMHLIRQCFKAEEEWLAAHGGRLMEGLEETLKKLKKDYRLYIVSNCQDGYIQVFLEAHQMQEYFDGFICAGDSGMSKGKNNLLLMEREGLKNPVYVGDTEGDMNSAIEADIPFVFCRFGFGTVECEHNIDKLSELPALLKEI